MYSSPGEGPVFEHVALEGFEEVHEDRHGRASERGVVVPRGELFDRRSEIRMGLRVGDGGVLGNELLIRPDDVRDEVGRGRAGVVLVVDCPDGVLDRFEVVDGDGGARLEELGDSLRAEDGAPVLVAGVLLVIELFRGFGVPVV